MDLLVKLRRPFFDGARHYPANTVVPYLGNPDILPKDVETFEAMPAVVPAKPQPVALSQIAKKGAKGPLDEE